MSMYRDGAFKTLGRPVLPLPLHMALWLVRQRLRQWPCHLQQWLYDCLPDRYVQASQFKHRFGRPLNFAAPTTFNEKLHRISEVDTDRFTTHLRDIFDLDWTLLPFSLEFPSSGRAIPRPMNLETMISAARAFSQGFPFVRVDFYSMGVRVIFGEMTWYPAGGLGRFTPDIYDLHVGEALTLPKRSSHPS
jgi:hypothetical protein